MSGLVRVTDPMDLRIALAVPNVHHPACPTPLVDRLSFALRDRIRSSLDGDDRFEWGRIIILMAPCTGRPFYFDMTIRTTSFPFTHEYSMWTWEISDVNRM